MSKRFIYPQQYGERKKAKLDVTISDHNFPLSQNSGYGKATNPADAWGDENDDEILLLASQACEEVYNDDSLLPDYSMCMQPPSTSTQVSIPSTSKTDFKFKKPISNPPTMISTQSKNECDRISSPLPGMSLKVASRFTENNVSDDLMFCDKIYKGDNNQLYKQLLQLQEENSKLKTENGKLLDKCVTKEGEASILRTQLKSCQVAVDNARLEKLRSIEKVQIEWNEKFTAITGQMQDLRNQLDFKNLEIISIKEKCRMLESSKIKMTQVTVTGNDVYSSHKNNHSIHSASDNSIMHRKAVKTVSNWVQTDCKANFIKLNITSYSDISSSLTKVLPLILKQIPDQQHSILDYNCKLQNHTDLTQNKCKIYSTFHRMPSSPLVNRNKSKVKMESIYEDLTSIAVSRNDIGNDKYFKVFNVFKSILEAVQLELETVALRMNTAFQKDMDEQYIKLTSSYMTIKKRDLLSCRSLYDEEQGIEARRFTTVLVYMLENSRNIELYCKYEKDYKQNANCTSIIKRICNLLDSTSCATLYSGLLLSLSKLVQRLEITNEESSNRDIYIDIIKDIITSRPLPFVSMTILKLLRKIVLDEKLVSMFCPRNNGGNLKLDYEQGVLLYKKDSCLLQILLKQIEAALKCTERQNLVKQALRCTRNLIALCSNMSGYTSTLTKDKLRCDCLLILMQVTTYALCICATFLKNIKDIDSCLVLSVCRSGIQLLFDWSLKDIEFTTKLSYNEGHFIEFCQILKDYDHSELHGNMLTDLTASFQSAPEETTLSYYKQAWLKSFQSFSISE